MAAIPYLITNGGIGMFVLRCLCLPILVLSFLLIGCEQKVVKSVLDDVAKSEMPEEIDKPDSQVEVVDDNDGVDTETETDPELPPIVFEPDIPEKPELPEFLSPGDYIHYVTELWTPKIPVNNAGEPDLAGEVHQFEPFIFDDAASVLADELILDYIELLSINISEYCKKESGQENNYRQIAGITIHFPHPNVEERDKLVDHLRASIDAYNVIKYTFVLDDRHIYYGLLLDGCCPKRNACH